MFINQPISATCDSHSPFGPFASASQMKANIEPWQKTCEFRWQKTMNIDENSRKRQGNTMKILWEILGNTVTILWNTWKYHKVYEILGNTFNILWNTICCKRLWNIKNVEHIHKISEKSELHHPKVHDCMIVCS